MTFIKFLFFAFLAYIAFKFVFNFVIPVYRTTKKVKRGFREMQEKMQEHAQQYQQQQQAQSTRSSVPDKKTQTGDYIEFEEVK